MRQLAVIVIMAQMGSYVPADQAELPIFDAIFTHVGAEDDWSGWVVNLRHGGNDGDQQGRAFDRSFVHPL